MALSSISPLDEKFPAKRVMHLSLHRGRKFLPPILWAKRSRTVFEPTSKEAYRGTGMGGLIGRGFIRGSTGHSASDQIPQVPTYFKERNSFGGNVHGLPCLGVPPSFGISVLDLETPKTPDLDLLSPAQGRDHLLENAIDDGFCLPPAEAFVPLVHPLS
jgi:hypothetical protein